MPSFVAGIAALCYSEASGEAAIAEVIGIALEAEHISTMKACAEWLRQEARMCMTPHVRRILAGVADRFERAELPPRTGVVEERALHAARHAIADAMLPPTPSDEPVGPVEVAEMTGDTDG